MSLIIKQTLANTQAIRDNVQVLYDFFLAAAASPIIKIPTNQNELYAKNEAERKRTQPRPSLRLDSSGSPCRPERRSIRGTEGRTEDASRQLEEMQLGRESGHLQVLQNRENVRQLKEEAHPSIRSEQESTGNQSNDNFSASRERASGTQDRQTPCGVYGAGTGSGSKNC